MNHVKIKFGNLIPENNKKFVEDEITICFDCGSIDATILTFGVYCRDCRNFRLFKSKLSDGYKMEDTALNFD